jgi:hypothetical protein
MLKQKRIKQFSTCFETIMLLVKRIINFSADIEIEYYSCIYTFKILSKLIFVLACKSEEVLPAKSKTYKKQSNPSILKTVKYSQSFKFKYTQLFKYVI